MNKIELEKMVKEVIVEKTGYPEEVLENELDLEADLGIDSVKQMDIVAKLLEILGVKRESEILETIDNQEQSGQDDGTGEANHVKINTIQEMIDYIYDEYQKSSQMS